MGHVVVWTVVFITTYKTHNIIIIEVHVTLVEELVNTRNNNNNIIISLEK